MLRFDSASVRIANTKRAVDECLDISFGKSIPEDCRAVIVNSAIGHKLDRIADSIESRVPGAAVLATSCGGIVGREGAGEAITNMAIMAVSGPADEVAHMSVDNILSHNSYEKGLELAGGLKEKLPGVNVIYLLCPGIDIACNLVLDAFAEVFGDDVTIFGGTSADNYKAVATFQYADGAVAEHTAWALGFADPTLKCITKATHGFLAYGSPMTVTKCDGTLIYELDGKPSWETYSSRMSYIPKDDPVLSVIAAGALAQELPPELAEEYGNAHILRGAVPASADGVMRLSITCEAGMKFRLTTRDEDLIFSEQEKALRYLDSELGPGKPAAVFQTDCLARGRTLFNRVMKDELIGMMHEALSYEGIVPPWLGMYGFGEFAKLGGKNTFHTYTTSLMVLYRF